MSKKVGLIIAGAGARIPQELALIYHLIEEKGLEPTVLTGTSSGSLSSVFLNGVLQNKAGKGNLSWDMLKNILFNLSNDDIYKSSALLNQKNDQNLKQILGTIEDLISDKGLGEILDGIKLVWESAKDQKSLGEVLSAIADAWKNGYFFDTAPLKDTLTQYVNGDNYIGYATFGECYLPTYISAVDDVSGKTQRFFSKNQDDAQFNPVDILLASTAIPVAFPARSVGGTAYIDGGTATDDIPVEDMIQDGFFDQVYIVAPQNTGLITGNAHTFVNASLLSNALFAIDVSQGAIVPFQLARAMNLVQDKSKAFYYSPILSKSYSLLDFTGQVLMEQFNESLDWARANDPKVIKDFLPEIGFPV
jgi:predicted acylesterase/phospholipase RssA